MLSYHGAENCWEWRRSTWASWALAAITALPSGRNMKNQNAHSSYQPPAFLHFVDRDQRKHNLLLRAGVRMSDCHKLEEGTLTSRAPPAPCTPEQGLPGSHRGNQDSLESVQGTLRFCLITLNPTV